MNNLSIGPLLRRLRSDRGWDQRALAKELAVGQQAVSNWERGTSRPRRSMVQRLAQVLGVDVATLMEAAGYVGTSIEIEVVPPPRATRLPLSGLSAEVFEQFTADFTQFLFPNLDVHRFGTQGHRQFGFDVVGYQGSNVEVGLQCKRHQRFGPADVRDAVAAGVLPANRRIIMLTRTASAEARREVAQTPGWELWDVDDISRKVRMELLRDQALRLVDTYFPSLRHALLGVAAPSPWLSVEDYFRRLGNNALVPYDNELVGQDNVLGRARAYLDDPEMRFAVLVGRGGLGKTRLSREIADIAGDVLDVRFLDRDATVTAEQFELLITPRPCLVIVDDAHDRGDLAALVRGALSVSANNKVLLTARPFGLTTIMRSVQQVGISLTDDNRWLVAEPTEAAARSLAVQALRDKASDQWVSWLAAATRDCPLLTVLGGRLVSDDQLDASVLAASPTVREQILLAFRDAMVGESVGRDADLRKATLDLVAAIQPLQTDDASCRSTMEQVLEVPFDRAHQHLTALESAGVVLRRGASFRVVPDLLGDVILGEVATDQATGISTGYLERVLTHSDGRARQHLFVNASRVDWQIGRDAPRELPLVAQLWDAFEAELMSADEYERSRLLQVAQKASFFQPDRALKLAQVALNLPDQSETLTDEIAHVLLGVTYSLEYLPEAVNLLWALGRADHRETRRHPRHPIRVLQEVASYEPAKPVVYNHTLLRAAAAWLDDPRADDAHSPFDVLDPLLATEGVEHSSDQFQVTMRGFGINIDAVKPLRDEVLRLARDQLRSPHLRQAIRAATSFENALRYPIGIGAQRIEDEARDRWTPDFVLAIDALKEVAADTSLDPVIGIAIRKALQWHVTYSQMGTRDAARRVVESLPDTLEHRLALLLHDAWGSLDRDKVTDYQDHQKDVDRRLVAFAAELLEDKEDDELLDLLEDRIAADQEAFNAGRSQPGRLVAELVAHRPAVGTAICARIQTNVDSGLLPALSAVLWQLAISQPDEVVALADALMATGSRQVRAAVLNAFTWSRGSRSLVPGEENLLLMFAEDDDSMGRLGAARAAFWLGESHPREALRILLKVRFDDSSAVADQVMSSFSPSLGKLQWTQLSRPDQKYFLSQLAATPEIDGYNTHQVLSVLAEQRPRDFLKLMMARVEAGERDPDLRREPFPFQWQVPIKLGSSIDIREERARARSWLAEAPDSWFRHHHAPKLFHLLIGQFDDSVIALVEDEIAGGAPDRFDFAAALLRGAPKQFAFDHPELVERLLRAAEEDSPRSLSEVSAALYSSVNSGVRMGAPGQPFAEDIEVRDRADEIARRLVPGSRAEQFYCSLARSATESISWSRRIDATLIDNRDW